MDYLGPCSITGDQGYSGDFQEELGFIKKVSEKLLIVSDSESGRELRCVFCEIQGMVD